MPKRTDAIPLNEKYLLTISEAARYFGIGEKKLRMLADNYPGQFSVMCGNRRLINRSKFENFLENTSAI